MPNNVPKSIAQQIAANQRESRENSMGYMDQEEMRDAAIAEAARRHAKAMRTNIIAGHEQTLHDLGNALGDRLCDNAVMGQLIRVAVATSPLLAGQMLIDLIQKCVDSDAEIEAIKEIERVEQERATDPDNFMPNRAFMRQLGVAV